MVDLLQYFILLLFLSVALISIIQYALFRLVHRSSIISHLSTRTPVSLIPQNIVRISCILFAFVLFWRRRNLYINKGTKYFIVTTTWQDIKNFKNMAPANLDLFTKSYLYHTELWWGSCCGGGGSEKEKNNSQHKNIICTHIGINKL